jgi:hypothetical protein
MESFTQMPAQQPINPAALAIVNSQATVSITAALDRNVAALLTNTVEIIRALKELRGESLDEKTVMRSVQKTYYEMLSALNPKAPPRT